VRRNLSWRLQLAPIERLLFGLQSAGANARSGSLATVRSTRWRSAAPPAVADLCAWPAAYFSPHGHLSGTLSNPRKMQDHAHACGAAPAIEHVCSAAKGSNDATFLREACEKSGSAEGMVNAALCLFRGHAS
jgi:hypothetical protein